MRIYLIGVLTIFLFLIIYSQSKYVIGMPSKCRYSTLDSLQGSWISIDDSLNRVSVLNRTYIEFYADKDSARENFRIYFSDTLVDINLSFSNIHIDTTALSGHYIITKSVLDDTFWCYEFNGFNNDGINRYFSISDTWAKHKPTVFAKQ